MVNNTLVQNTIADMVINRPSSIKLPYSMSKIATSINCMEKINLINTEYLSNKENVTMAIIAPIIKSTRDTIDSEVPIDYPSLE